MTDIHASVENQVLVSDSHASQLQDWLENALIRAGKAQHLSFCNHNQGLMSTSASSGSLEPSSAFDVIDLHVRCLNCEGCMLKLSGSSMGLEVRRLRRMVLFRTFRRVALHCISLMHPWCFTKPCGSKASWAGLQHCLALMSQQICMPPGVQFESKVPHFRQNLT